MQSVTDRQTDGMTDTQTDIIDGAFYLGGLVMWYGVELVIERSRVRLPVSRPVHCLVIYRSSQPSIPPG